MGLASKIKNSSDATPQSSAQPPALPVGGVASGYGYGASPPRDYPQKTGHQHVAPSAPPDPQQYYDAAAQSQRRESKPSAPSFYAVQGQTSPYGGQGQTPPYGGQTSPYGQQGQTPPYGGQTSPYGGQGQRPPYGQQGQTPPYSLPYGEQVNAGAQPSYAYGGQGQGQAPPYSSPYGEQVNAGAQPSYAYGGQGQGHSTPYGEQGYAGAQPSYGQPPGGGFGPPQYQQAPYQQPMAANTNMLTQKLQAIIQANGLQAFYDEGRFRATVQKVASINFAEIAAQWKISKELAYDLAPLALYDIVFYCDDSGSMAFEENGERIDDLKFILSKVSGIATLFDDDGIIVRFMNSDVNGDGIRNAADVANLITKVRFSGMTPLGTNLDRKVIQPFVIRQAMSNMVKPVLAIAITDGEPSGEGRGTIREVIYRAKDALNRTRYGGGALAVQIAQVGKDAQTQKFLESLDNDPVVGKMIDCTSYYELEEAEFARKGVTLSPELWLLKMCVGAIDPEYDSKDD